MMLAVWVKVVDITFDERGPKARLLPMLLWTTHKNLKAGMLRASAASRPRDCKRRCLAFLRGACLSCWRPLADPRQHISTALEVSLPTLPRLISPMQIGCSIKLVSQTDGTDLDPANSKYRPRGEGGGGFQVQTLNGSAYATLQTCRSMFRPHPGGLCIAASTRVVRKEYCTRNSARLHPANLPAGPAAHWGGGRDHHPGWRR